MDGVMLAYYPSIQEYLLCLCHGMYTCCLVRQLGSVDKVQRSVGRRIGGDLGEALCGLADCLALLLGQLQLQRAEVLLETL